MTRLRAALDRAKYPPQYRVSRAELETVESYLQARVDDSRARWTAAGRPSDWPEHLTLFAGPNFGPLFKGVELLHDG